MLDSVFQNSKSTLAFAGVVIVSAMMLVGSEDSGGVLEKAVVTYKAERANIANNAAAASNELSFVEAPSGSSRQWNSAAPGESDADMAAAMPFNPSAPTVVTTSNRAMIDLSREPALPAGMSPEGAPSMRAALIPGSYDSGAAPSEELPAQPQAQVPREAVVTSRMIRIEPK
jgi:hypothetical protein